jgi:hypothetical protein
MYEGVSRSFRTGRLERELKIVQLSATRFSFITISWVSLVRFAAITLCVASQRVIAKVSLYFVMTQSGNFWIHLRTVLCKFLHLFTNSPPLSLSLSVKFHIPGCSGLSFIGIGPKIIRTRILTRGYMFVVTLLFFLFYTKIAVIKHVYIS